MNNNESQNKKMIYANRKHIMHLRRNISQNKIKINNICSKEDEQILKELAKPIPPVKEVKEINTEVVQVSTVKEQRRHRSHKKKII